VSSLKPAEGDGWPWNKSSPKSLPSGEALPESQGASLPESQGASLLDSSPPAPLNTAFVSHSGSICRSMSSSSPSISSIRWPRASSEFPAEALDRYWCHPRACHLHAFISTFRMQRKHRGQPDRGVRWAKLQPQPQLRALGALHAADGTSTGVDLLEDLSLRLAQPRPEPEMSARLSDECCRARAQTVAPAGRVGRA
jgi:hypothetical protein